MNRPIAIAASVVLSCWLIPGTGMAATPVPAPGDWSVVDRQPASTELIVVLRGGEEVRGRLTRATPEDLTLLVWGQPVRAVPKSAVERVTTAAVFRDGVKDGMTKGTVLGALAGAAVVGIMYAGCKGSCEAPSIGGPLAMGLAVGAGGGLAAGALIDRAHDSRLVLYRAPAPAERR